MNQQAGLSRQILISLCLLSAIVLLGISLTRQGRSEEPPAPPQDPNAAVQVSRTGQQALHIETATVGEETLSADLQTTGLVSYPADQTVKVSPRLQGRIRQVFVHVGDHVAAGQPLAILDSVDAASAQTTAIQNENKLRLAQLNLQRAERLFRLGTPEVTQARSALNQARAQTLYTRDALDKIREQAMIGSFTDKPLEDARNAEVAANSTLAQAQADLAQAQKDNNRKVKLVQIGVASQSDLEASEDVLAKAKASVEAGRQQLDLAREALAREQKAHKTNLYAEQQVHAAESSYRQAQLQEAAAVTALKLTQAAVRTALDQARSDYQAALADAQNSRHALALLGNPNADGSVKVLAPIDGIVTERDVNPGQVVDQSQMTPWQMFVISNAATVWVDADIYEKDVATISPGEPARIRIAALPDRVFSGRVLHIAPTLDSKSRAIKARMEIANPNGLIKDGMFADVIIIRPHGQPVTVVPLEAIQHAEDQDYVYVAVDGKYIRRAVRLGAQRDGKCVVLEGLKPGEQIVTHGALYLGQQGNND